MAVNERTFGATITLDSNTDKTWHTYTDWGLYCTSPEPIGDPELETNYIEISGRPCLLDASEALTGKPVFKGRKITMQMALSGDPWGWEAKVSSIRNLIDGRKVRIQFDDDRGFFWLGRIRIEGADRVKKLGRFTMSTYADAYKYEMSSAQDDILWDDVDFELTYFRYIGTLTVTDSHAEVIPKSNMETVPVFTVSNITSENFKVKSSLTGNTKHTLNNGRNRIPQIKVGGTSDVTLTFEGTAKVVIDYRGGSL